MIFAEALVFVRADSAGANKGDLDLLAAAARFASSTLAVCLGPLEGARHFMGLCDECLVSADLAGRPDAAALASFLGIRLAENSLALLRHDSLGMDIGPGLATLLGMDLLTNICGLSWTSGKELRAQRPEYNGQMLAEYAVALDPTRPGVLLTVRPGAFSGLEAPAPRETKVTMVAVAGSGRVFLEETRSPASGVNLRAASVLVAVGRGMGSAENIAAALRLAAVLGGETCCTRAAADAGWLDKDRQVGLSGESVSPDMYLAFGLHGAFQHMAGVQGSPCIVAVNTNKDAPIFHNAEIGIVADAASFALLLADALESGT